MTTETKRAYEQDCQKYGRKKQRQFLGEFAKLRQATLTFFMSLCLSTVRPSFLPHVTTPLPMDRFFMKFGILEVFENLLRKLDFR